MKTILIADEDTRVRNLVRLVFTEHMGYRVIDAPTGTDALIKSKEIKPDVVLVDVSLSNQSGYYVSKEIKNDPALENTSVVLFTSAFVASSRRGALEAYADDVIMKPFNPGEMARKVELLVNGSEERVVKSDLPIQAEKILEDENLTQIEKLDRDMPEQEKFDYFRSFSIVLLLVVKNLGDFYSDLKSCTSHYFRSALEEVSVKRVPEGPIKTTWSKVYLQLSEVCRSIAESLTVLQVLAENFRSAYESSKNRTGGLAGRLDRLKEKGFPSKIQIKPDAFRISFVDRRHPLIACLGLGMVALVIIPVIFTDRRGKDVIASSDFSRSAADFFQYGTNAGLEAPLSPDRAYERTFKDGISAMRTKETEGVLTKEKTKELQPENHKRKAQEELERVGAQKEVVKPEVATEPKEKPKKDKYLVKRGDTLSVIADRFNVSVRDLRIVNDIRGDRIYAGEVLIIPRGVIRREVARRDVLDPDSSPGGVEIVDWDLYIPWSGVAVLHHVFIENTSDEDFKSIKVKLYYYYDSNSDRITRGEATAILPITVPRKSKRIYLEEGVVLRGDFNVNSMYVKNGSIEVLEAVPQRYSAGYSLNR